MFVIQNETDLKKVCGQQYKVIIYGAGLVAHVIVQYLLKLPYGECLDCVVVKSRKDNPEEILGIPVLQMDELSEQQTDAVFIIATLENFHSEILRELEFYHYTEIAAIGNNFYRAIRRQQADFTCDVICKLNKIQLEVQELFYYREMGKIREVNYQTFSPFLGIHKEKEIVIVATGPSLQKYKPIPEAIHIGVNTAYKMPDITFDYYFVQDYTGKSIKTVEDIKKEAFIKFFGKFMECSGIHQHLAERMEIPEQKAIEANARRYYLDWPLESPIHRDIRYAPLMDYHSVVFPAIQFALFCNPRKIYLVGCDCSQNGHFNQDKQDALMVDGVLRGYSALKKFAEKHYPETEIISINPVGLKGFFKDIYIDEQ